MRRLAVAALIAAGLIGSAWQVGRAQTKVNEFQIVVSPTATGLKAHCVKGCAWIDVTYDCGPAGKTECKAEIDQLGIGGVK